MSNFIFSVGEIVLGVTILGAAAAYMAGVVYVVLYAWKAVVGDD